MLGLTDVTKIYPRQHGIVRPLDGITLSVESGEFVAVQGPSGSGKTTLLLTAGGLLRPDEGRVFLDEQNLYEMNPDERARFRAKNIGFVFQQYHLIPYLTVLENVMTPNLAQLSSNSRGRANKLIEHFGLTERSGHTPGELSAGEKQRTALARALFHQPKILFADEITGNLDQQNAHIVLNYLKEFAQSGGAVLLVTHDVQVAQSAQKKWSLVNGQLSF